MTHEQWEKIKPFAEAKQRADNAYTVLLGKKAPKSAQEFSEYILEVERRRVEYRAAEMAFYKAVKQYAGIDL